MDRKIVGLLLLAGSLALAGCAADAPLAIRQAPSDNPALAAARADPATYQGRRVRWGGTIARVENLPESTRVEVVARPLFGYGEPESGDLSDGRFIAEVPAFLDPKIYAEGRAFTVSGTLEGDERGTIGKMPYRFPRVKVEAYHLWPELPAPCTTCDPMLFPPWYPYGYPFGPPYDWRYRPPPP